MRKILIVDDSSEMRNLLEWVLEDAGFSSTSAESGKSAFELLQKEEVSLVITDLEMEDGDGLWLLRRMREAGYAQKVIVNSGNPQISGEEILKAGAARFFRKPYQLKELLEALQGID